MADFIRWQKERRNPAAQQLPPEGGLAALTSEQLEEEKTRSEIGKLRIEIQELRAWRSKLVFTATLSVLAPLGSVLLFLVGWFGSHASERIHQNDDLYNRAATQLASSNASERLSAVTTLDHFAAPEGPTDFRSYSEHLFSSKSSASIAAARPQETMALLVGRLSVEDDSAVLDAIAREVSKNPTYSVAPLISMNKTAAVSFARAAGELSALAVLNARHAKALNQDDLADGGAKDPSVTDVANIVLRTGSPFEATARLNQQFSSRDFLTNQHCPFRELFKKQQRLNLHSDMTYMSRSSPPNTEDVQKAVEKVIAAAARLERTSYILGHLAASKWEVLQNQNLFGTAVVVGDLDPNVITLLRSRGSYFQAPQDSSNNPGCAILPSSVRDPGEQSL